MSGREAETIPRLRSAWARVGLTRLAVTGAGTPGPRISVEAGRVLDLDTCFGRGVRALEQAAVMQLASDI